MVKFLAPLHQFFMACQDYLAHLNRVTDKVEHKSKILDIKHMTIHKQNLACDS